MSTPNERRVQPDMTKVYAAIEKMGARCSKEHAETQKTLADIAGAQVGFGARISGMEITLERIGNKLDATSEKVAATVANVGTLKNHSANTYQRLGEAEGDLKVLKAHGKKTLGPTGPDDSIKWIVGGAVSVCVLLLISYGAMTTHDIATLIPLAGQ